MAERRVTTTTATAIAAAVATATALATEPSAPEDKPKKLPLLLRKIGGFLDRRLLIIWCVYLCACSYCHLCLMIMVLLLSSLQLGDVRVRPRVGAAASRHHALDRCAVFVSSAVCCCVGVYVAWIALTHYCLYVPNKASRSRAARTFPRTRCSSTPSTHATRTRRSACCAISPWTMQWHCGLLTLQYDVLNRPKRRAISSPH